MDGGSGDVGRPTLLGLQSSPRGTPGVSAGTLDTLLNCIDDSGGIRMGDYVLLINTKDDGWYVV
jgi:hypothetical protein